MAPAVTNQKILSHAATREHLLEAAAGVFSETGYRAATVRHICDRAGANIAAVNYHFGDKKALYRAVLRASHDAVMAKFPLNDALNPRHRAEDRLRMFIRIFLMKLISEGPTAWHGKIMSREMIEPTGLLEEIMREDIRPMSEELHGIVSELIGGKPGQEAVRLCCMSVVSQVLYYHHCRPAISILFPELKFDETLIEKLTEHITRFSLAGMKAYSRKQAHH